MYLFIYLFIYVYFDFYGISLFTQHLLHYHLSAFAVAALRIRSVDYAQHFADCVQILLNVIFHFPFAAKSH